MEDQRNHKAQSAKHGDKKIVELTREMELPDQNSVDIIDLTDGVDSTDMPPVEPMPVPADTAIETPPEDPAPENPQTPAPSRRIEDEVDAAFEEELTAPPQDEEEQVPDEQLFDRLSGITEVIDNAVRENESHQAGDAEDNEIKVPTPNSDADDTLAADAEIVATAMETEPEEEEILDLTDVIDPVADADAVDEDDEVIELIDIADVTEDNQAHLIESEEEDILELTDWVDPAETVPEDIEAEEVLELTDIVTPAEMDAVAEESPAEKTDETDIVEPSMDAQETPVADTIGAGAAQKNKSQEPAVSETEEIADLFVQKSAIDELATEESDQFTIEQDVGIPLPDAPDSDAEEEQVIQLSDVLGQTVREERMPIEKIKMGAEEDLAAQPISLEREDTANAMGMDLEEGQSLRDPKIEAAIEHILQTKYAETIERLVAEAVEKTVKREVEALKRSLEDRDARA